MEETSLNPLLAVEGDSVCFSFGRKKEDLVLNGLNIKVDRGVIYGLLGPSGCGKTTLLRCIVGRYMPSTGTIKIYGKSPGQKGFAIPGPGIGFMPQELALYPEITTEETLNYFGHLYEMDSSTIKERISFLANFLNIPDKKKQIKHLSGGQKRRVSFAVALIHKPPLVILDEPTVGVDPLLRNSIWNHLQDLVAKNSTTIIITTHYVEEARQAQVVGFIRDGRILAEKNPELLLSQYNAITLEDAFLKICIRDSSDTPALEENEDQKTENVWIPRRVQQMKYTAEDSSVEMFNNVDQHKVELLDNSFDPEVLLMKNSSIHQLFKSSFIRLGALINKNFVRLKRNVPLAIFQIIVPVFLAIVFCLCVGGEPFNLPLAVVNLEDDPFGQSVNFLDVIDSRTIIQKSYSNLSIAIESVKRGENLGVLYIGPYFTESAAERYVQGINANNETIENSTIKLYLDMTNQQLSSTIYAHIMKSFQTFAENSLRKFNQNTLLSSPPVVLGTPIYGELNPDFTEFMAPGMIIGITYMMAVGISALSIILEKKEGLLDRSWAAGVHCWEVMFSIMFTLFMVMILQMTMILIFTFIVFSIPTKGPLIWIIISVALVGIEGMCYGMLVSAIANDENIAMMVALGSFYSGILLSGIIWPLEAMPYYIKQFSYCLPLTLIADTLRSILSRGWTITDNGIWAGYVVTIVWTIFAIVISAIFFKIKKIKKIVFFY